MAFDPITSILDIAGSILNKIFPDKTKAQEQAFNLAMQQELNNSALLQKQLAVNAVEAANSNIFVSGWRPFAGWVLVIIMAFNALFLPMSVWICGMLHYQITSVPEFPPFVFEMLMGLLGLNMGARSYEKIKGVK